jgi:hypothetical protein
MPEASETTVCVALAFCVTEPEDVLEVGAGVGHSTHWNGLRPVVTSTDFGDPWCPPLGLGAGEGIAPAGGALGSAVGAEEPPPWVRKKNPAAAPIRTRIPNRSWFRRIFSHACIVLLSF